MVWGFGGVEGVVGIHGPGKQQGRGRLLFLVGAEALEDVRKASCYGLVWECEAEGEGLSTPRSRYVQAY